VVCDPAGVEIRPAGPGEDDAVRQVVAEAFGDGGHVAALWSEVEARGLARASLVAVAAGAVVGHVGLSHAWLDARPRLVDVLMLSPLSVRSTHQGQAVGTALVAAALEVAEQLNAPAVFLEGSPAYYGRRGFEPAVEHGFEAPSRRTPEPAFQAVRLSRHEGWMVGRVVYHDLWWEYDAAGLR
jgi:putative acetyltransferase